MDEIVHNVPVTFISLSCLNQICNKIEKNTSPSYYRTDFSYFTVITVPKYLTYNA